MRRVFESFSAAISDKSFGVRAAGDSGPRHLTRNERERCVMARVQRTGLRFYRCFALRRHGSWEAAEAAARLWLRPVLAQLATLPAGPGRPTARNRSGVVGVFFRARPRILKSGRAAAYPAYVARWPGAPAGGVTWMFSGSGGEDGAFLRACLSRELATADRLRVEWAVRSLSPERRDEMLARKRPAEAGLERCTAAESISARPLAPEVAPIGEGICLTDAAS